MYKIRVNVSHNVRTKQRQNSTSLLKKTALIFLYFIPGQFSTEHAVKSLQASLTTERIIGKISLSAILKII